MPLETKLSELTVNTQGDATALLLDGGYIEVLTGPKPADADEPLLTQKVLVTLGFGKPAFKPTSGGVMVSNPLVAGIAGNTGDPAWFRAYTAERRPVFDGTAGKANANMILPVKTIVEGITVSVAGLTHTIVKALPGV